jgi:hypothetical protein
MPSLTENVPEALRELPQWVLWRYEDRDGKATKVPYTAMGYRASATNSQQWSRVDYLVGLLTRNPGFAAGIGFVFTAEDPFCGIDLDNIWPSDAAECAPWARGILERFADTYGEASPSDTGYKIWCSAVAPRCGKWPVQGGAVEIYDRERFFTVTGRSAGIQVITDHQTDIQALVGNLDQDRHLSPVRVIPGVIPQGQRHNTLLSLAGTMWRRGMSLAAVEAALLVTDETQCDPPHGPEHIRKIVASMAPWKR